MLEKRWLVEPCKAIYSKLKYKNIFTKYCVLYKVGIGANLVSTAYCTL